MPVYEYQCKSCGLRFEKMVRISEKDSVLCDCGNKAQSIISGNFGMTADYQTSGIVPQNTGSNLDYEFDRIIAKDSQEKWEIIDKRNAYKREVLRKNPNALREDLIRTIDGDYTITTPDKKKAFKERIEKMRK